MSEEIGKHKGAVETLLHEKKELSRILNIVNSQLQRHMQALEEAGIDTEEFINDLQQESQDRQKKQQKQQQRRQENKQRGKQSGGNKQNSSSDEEFDLSGHLE